MSSDHQEKKNVCKVHSYCRTKDKNTVKDHLCTVLTCSDRFKLVQGVCTSVMDELTKDPRVKSFINIFFHIKSHSDHLLIYCKSVPSGFFFNYKYAAFSQNQINLFCFLETNFLQR